MNRKCLSSWMISSFLTHLVSDFGEVLYSPSKWFPAVCKTFWDQDDGQDTVILFAEKLMAGHLSSQHRGLNCKDLREGETLSGAAGTLSGLRAELDKSPWWLRDNRRLSSEQPSWMFSPELGGHFRITCRLVRKLYMRTYIPSSLVNWTSWLPLLLKTAWNAG